MSRKRYWTWASLLGCLAASIYACGSSDDAGSDGANDGTGGAASASGGASAAPITGGPRFEGASSEYRPLSSGCGPNTADECTGTCEESGGDPNATVIRPPATLCFYGTGEEASSEPAVTIEQVIETVDGQSYVHLRITFNPDFVDNTYGENATPDWSGGHTFKDLVGSDHTEILITDGAGETMMDFRLDYISADETAQCGFAALGVSGGEGRIDLGDPSCVLAAATSLSRNLNHCGFSECYDLNSPLQSDLPEWDNRVVYEVWLDLTCFGDAGFGQAYMTLVHASPSKLSTNTITVEPAPCPPDWDKPFCPVNLAEEGANCFNEPGDAGTSDGCPVNYQLYIASEGASSCTPIPFANYPNMAPCPEGYHLDLASEGKYCLPD